MMSISNITFSKLFNEDNTKVFRLKVEWEDDCFRLFVMDGNKAWFAKVTTEQLKKLAGQHELSFNDYMQNLQESICNSLASITDKGEFILYRNTEKEKFKKLKVKYFVTKLEEKDRLNYVEELIDDLVAKHSESTKLLLAQDKQILKAEEQKNILEHKCLELAEMKNKSDREIYSAVAVLLNEKKDRIQFLTELLEECQNGAKPIKTANKNKNEVPKSLQNSTNSKVPDAKPSTSKHEVMSDSDPSSNDGYNTEEEHCSTKQEKRSSDNLDFLGDEVPTTSIVPKRFRNDNPVSVPECSKISFQEENILSKINTVEETNITNTSNDQSQSLHYDNIDDLLDMM